MEIDWSKRRLDIMDAIEYSVLSYADIDLSNIKDELSEFDHLHKISNATWGVQGLCFVKNGVGHIVFRGSDDPLDWLLNFMAIPVGLPFWPFRKPLVHFGFLQNWKTARPVVRKWLEKHASEINELRFTGHSLGGATAQLAAFELSRKFAIKDVITFGAPKFSFLWARKAYDNATLLNAGDATLGDVTLSVVHKSDLVSRVPIWPFRPVGELAFIDKEDRLLFGEEAKKARSALARNVMKTFMPMDRDERAMLDHEAIQKETFRNQNRLADLSKLKFTKAWPKGGYMGGNRDRSAETLLDRIQKDERPTISANQLKQKPQKSLRNELRDIWSGVNIVETGRYLASVYFLLYPLFAAANFIYRIILGGVDHPSGPYAQAILKTDSGRFEKYVKQAEWSFMRVINLLFLAFIALLSSYLIVVHVLIPLLKFAFLF